MPAPLAEITTEVCWPDRVTAPDLSLIVTTIRRDRRMSYPVTLALNQPKAQDVFLFANPEKGKEHFDHLNTTFKRLAE